jgi:hypothetical protein
MRFVTKQEFLTLPEGTIFSRFKPNVITDLAIKAETVMQNDFCYIDLVGNVDAYDSGEYLDTLDGRKRFKADYECSSRDGMFDPKQEFVIYEKSDVQDLINVLHLCLKEGYK